MASNREIAPNLVDVLLGAITADEATKSVIFGSAAAALHGVDLDRTISDLDVFVAAETFQGLASRFAVEHKHAEDGDLVPFISPAGRARIEILKTFPGVAFEAVFSRAHPLDIARGLKVGSLADLRTWKLKQRRPKDLRDAEAIDRFLRKERRR